MIKTSINDYLKSLPYWEKMVGSQYINGISNLVEQVGERFAQRCERALQESRISTAVKRSSILAEAEDKGYVGRKSTPSLGRSLVTNTSSAFISIPVGEPLISDAGVPYIFLDTVDLSSGSSVEVETAQLELSATEVTITEDKPYYEILLDKDDSKQVHRVDVYVKLPDSMGFTQWQKTYMFRNANEQSTVYTEVYKPTEQLGIRFGNGKDGMKPPVGSIVRLEIWRTEGVTSLLAGEQLSFVSDELNESTSVESLTPIVGGLPPESTEEIRLGAIYSTQYDDQVVWKDDYIHFIRQNIGGLDFLNVWGEQQQEEQDGFLSLANNRTIFISAFDKERPEQDVKEEVLNLVQSLPMLNRRYKFVQPVIKPIPIVFSGEVPRTISLNDAEAVLRSAIEERYGLGKLAATNSFFETRVDILEKDLWVLVDGLGKFSDFNLEVTGLDAVRKLEDYRYIDLSSSTLTIQHSNKA
ncbi:hypothetical protein [Pseudoalteromonas ruthenica]|uniref:hypothetical protein n=1 Tax=Pseudoalteromonas ruthenica TaxID=151081 RepID=UPI00110BF36C|nr:hypothetical protein [Pseudoalteromonas ruthenica]TMO87699.1 hypothetical protein CWC12_10500 [Pseudoalteromonas ruthenica]TMP21504.1 hypothetical protein CWC06_18325 [Pseudoalteromonas ruthenica]